MATPLTPKRATDLQPKNKRYDVQDTKVAALFLRVGTSGKKTWRVKAWRDGRYVTKTIGTFKANRKADIEMTPIEARDEAERVLAKLGRKGDTAQNKATLRSIPTLKDWWEKFRVSNPNRWTDRTMSDHRSRMKNYVLPRLGSKKLHNITSADLEDLTLEVERESGARTANMCRTRVLSLLQWAEGRGLMPEDWKSPTCKPAEENPPRQDNFIPRHKAMDFLEAVEALRNRATPPSPHDGTMADVILMALFTGQRKSNVKAMRWDQISGNLWTIPISEYKTRRKIKDLPPVPLVPQAKALLDHRFGLTGDSPWVFPSPRREGEPIENDKSAWSWVRNRAGLPHVTFHGLRHTLGTWQGQDGANQMMIAAALGHKSAATTERYVHADLETVRANMSRAIDTSFEVLQDDHQADQVTISRDLAERAIRSVKSKKVREELRQALEMPD